MCNGARGVRRRFSRVLFNTLTVVSLALFAAMLAGWGRSCVVMDQIGWNSPATSAPVAIQSFGVVSARGRLSIDWASMKIGSLDSTQSVGWDRWRAKIGSGFRWRTRPPRPRSDSLPAFAIVHTDQASPTGWSTAMVWVDQWEVRCPYWFVCLLAAALPTAWGVRRRRASYRAAIGKCATCGYDLRATPERCPECGTVPIR